MHKIRRNDTIVVLAGKDKGKRGKVQRILTQEGRVIVEGINLVKRHLRPNPALRQAGIVQKEAALAISNVKLVCPSCSKPARIGSQLLEDGTKTRVCKQCHEVIP